MGIEIRCLASSSAGNSYAVDDGDSVLLLEAGIPAKKIIAGYNDLLPRVAGCLITHEHADHCMAAEDLAKRGISIYASIGTHLELGVVNHRRIFLVDQEKIGSWLVLPFETEHDTASPRGFLLYSTVTKERLLFATDTYNIKFQFSDLNIIMIECNYSLPVMLENVNAGRLPEAHKKRLMKSHLSLENAIRYLDKTDLSKVEAIYLLHASPGNIQIEEAVRVIEALTGIPTTAF